MLDRLWDRLVCPTVGCTSWFARYWGWPLGLCTWQVNRKGLNRGHR